MVLVLQRVVLDGVCKHITRRSFHTWRSWIAVEHCAARSVAMREAGNRNTVVGSSFGMIT